MNCHKNPISSSSIYESSMVWHDVAQNATVFYEGVAFFVCLKGLDSLWRLGRLIFVKQCCFATLVTA